VSSRGKKILAGVVGLIVVGLGAFWLLGKKDPSDIINSITGEPTVCPLSGEEPAREELATRPAIVVKVENNTAAYPLSGLDKAEIVYEELVEGGFTRFMAVYHCTDTRKAGPVRSSRAVDPEIMGAITRILGAAGGNAFVRDELTEAGIVLIDENAAGEAMRREDRPGITLEHTLYADTAKLRRLGAKEFSDPPPEGIFNFGDLPSGGKNASSVSMSFTGGEADVEWRYEGGKYVRYDDGAELPLESGRALADNVIVEIHTISFARGVVDVAGTSSIVIDDPTGSGKALLFRDGKVFVGTWERESVEDPMTFKLKSGDDMVLKKGTTWVELIPNKKGEVKGSFSHAR
jgi:Protein of unknown function (DUF3048) N-terminal domain/Protein of unknown function (DUF3048) C-terminal domain